MTCPGCSGNVKLDAGKMVGRCERCGGLVGECYLGDSYGLVEPRFHPDPNSVPDERHRYFDLTCLGSKGVTRRHGFYDTVTKLVLQVG